MKHFLDTLDHNMYIQTKRAGKAIYKFANNYKFIGVFPKGNKLSSKILTWTIGLFHQVECENSLLFTPSYYCGTTDLNEEENHYDYYDALIVVDVKTNQFKNNVTTTRGKIIENKKELNVLYVTYFLEKNENDEKNYHYIYFLD